MVLVSSSVYLLSPVSMSGLSCRHRWVYSVQRNVPRLHQHTWQFQLHLQYWLQVHDRSCRSRLCRSVFSVFQWQIGEQPVEYIHPPRHVSLLASSSCDNLNPNLSKFNQLFFFNNSKQASKEFYCSWKNKRHTQRTTVIQVQYDNCCIYMHGWKFMNKGELPKS